MKTILMILAALAFSSVSFADDSSTPTEWKNKPKESFSDPEASFNLVMKKLLDRYVDQGIGKDDLYRAATAGMLESLNGEHGGEGEWNRLISPGELADMRTELAGKVSGIGITLKYDEQQGYGRVLKLIAGSAAEKGGLQVGDEILSVNGAKFKGKPFRELVYAIRGKPGETVALRVLREDKILSVSLKREMMSWNEIELREVAPSTGLLTIGYFSEDAPARVREKLAEARRFKNLIVDLRDNFGGGFDQAIQVAGMFAPEGEVVASTKDRSGEAKTYRGQGSLVESSTRLTVLVDHDTTCGAELLASVLKETRGATLVGTKTSGKWNMQTVEMLPNHYGVKYTVGNFYSPKGESYAGTGIKPDLEIPLPDSVDSGEMRAQPDFHKRLAQDSQLRAAIELNRSG